MFRLIRTIFLVAIAFVSGILYERYGGASACENSGGTYVNGECEGTNN
ncbi:MAG: hypothetical protein ACI9PY_000221 [Ascidiaceihabitans sp.]|jgi:hypothetical protein